MASQSYPLLSPSDISAIIYDGNPHDYFGATGIGSVLSNLLRLIVGHGVMVVDSQNTLALLSGADTGIVAVKQQALYSYNPDAYTTISDLDVPANGGGRWEYMTSLGTPDFTKVIGDSINSVFTLDHGLNTNFPTVALWAASAPGGSAPYTLGGLPFTLTSTTPNQAIINFGAGIPASFQYTVVLKK